MAQAASKTGGMNPCQLALVAAIVLLGAALPANEQYVKADKALYVWSASTAKPTPRTSNHAAITRNDDGLADRLAAFCKLHGFSRVHLFLGSAEWDWESQWKQHKLDDEDRMAATFKALRGHGLELHLMWYLNDEPNDLSNHKRAVDLVDTIAGFNKRHPDSRITGLHCDQEPDTTEAYASLKEMFELVAARNKELKAGLELGAALKPLWLRQDWQGRKVFQHLVDALDTATIMAYSNNPALVKQLAAPLLQYCEKAKKHAEVAIETGSYNAAPEETFTKLVQDEPAKFLETAAALAADLAKAKGFDRLAIHDYSQYFRALYGVDPDDKHATPAALFGAIPSDGALPADKLPEGAAKFTGKLTGEVTVVGRTGLALQVSKAKGSGGRDGETLEDEQVVVYAAEPEHERWIASLKAGDEVTIEVTAKGEKLQIVKLTAAQKKAARQDG